MMIYCYNKTKQNPMAAILTSKISVQDTHLELCLYVLYKLRYPYILSLYPNFRNTSTPEGAVTKPQFKHIS